MRRAAKVDNNQSAIVARFRELYCSVQDLSSVGAGVPDLLVGCMGVNLLGEVKSAKGKKTPAQVDWHRLWRGQACVVRSVEEATDLVMKIQGES